MKKTVHQTFLAAAVGALTSFSAFTMAPVVDESENFALFDEQLAAAKQPEAFMPAEAPTPQQTEEALAQDNLTEEPVALAYDDTQAQMPEHASGHEDASVLLNKVQSLQQELSELRGQLEVQTHALQTLKKQQIDFYQDLDNRLREAKKTESAPGVETPTADNKSASISDLPESTTPRGNPADEQVSYLAAYELVKNKEFDKAVMAMKSFIQQYPRGGYTANAHYWLGEVYMVKKAFPDAIEQFQTVLSHFKSSSKASAAALKLGYALAEDGQTAAARERLQTVVRTYPDTHAAQLATAKLESLRG